MKKINMWAIKQLECSKLKRRGKVLNLEVFNDGKFYAAFVYQGDDDPNIVAAEALQKEDAVNQALFQYYERLIK